FRFAHARVGESMRACGALFLREGTQNDAGWLRLGFGLRKSRDGGWCGRRPARGRLLLRLDGWRRFGLGFARSADDAAFDLLDHNLLAAAMTEALTYHARLGARLERQRLARHAKF